ncbi:DUF1707 and DUF4870 domain-containing protein [Halostreptopolyspora alba]|uniref:DUF1707 and DUF4870 domain-containing protein n=1 Tax=Halostreptopolyspora alba TaxID=2487137 RepID=UPI0026A69885
MHDPTPPPTPYGRGWPVRYGPQNNHLRLTHADRDAVAHLLKEAYAEGRLDTDEFEERLEAAMGAKVHGDLEPLLSDLIPEGTPVHSPPAAQQPSSPPSSSERVTALIGHYSGYFVSALGPLAVLLINGNSSAFVRRHVVEALNFQLTFIVGSMVLWFFSWLVLPLVAWGFMLLGWMFLPMVAGLVAVFGGRWKYPFTWRPIKEDQGEPGRP